jgi:riboflavin biosynthesis pyrimidine reductase
MSKLRVSSFAVSIDGFGAGPDQDLQNPLGVGGVALMDWFFPTRTWRHMQGLEGGETGIDDQVAAQALAGLGAAGDRDIRLGGGVSTIRQYLRAGLIDELHLAVRPVLMGKGEALFAGIDLPALGYEAVKHVAGDRATHVYLRRRAT